MDIRPAPDGYRLRGLGGMHLGLGIHLFPVLLLKHSALLGRCLLNDANRRLLALETKRPAAIPEH